jgi:hypothetical protein
MKKKGSLPQITYGVFEMRGGKFNHPA